VAEVDSPCSRIQRKWIILFCRLTGSPDFSYTVGLAEYRMDITVEPTDLEDVKVITPDIYRDRRGFFMETFRRDQFLEHGLPGEFVQDNHSRSRRGVIRGLHFQYDPPMGKLMRVSLGEAFLVAVDIRVGSPTLGKWVGVTASEENRRQIWAPAGFARGFCVLSDYAEIQYKCTGIYNADGESGILYSDPDIGVAWPVDEGIVSPKDSRAQTMREWLESSKASCFRYQEGAQK
jgi:dTDP-4-dehydrorhamnose 3,5-epimerase